MAVHRITKGLDLPITGEPRQEIEVAGGPSKVALLAADYFGMRPTMRVAVGDQVKRGQVLFEDKKMPGVLYTAPGAGTVIAINRGDRRTLQSIVIELNEAERKGNPTDADFATFGTYVGKNPAELTADEIKALLIESGLWTSLRARPFGRVADPAITPRSIFVTAMDTNPLAASVDAVLRGKEKDFELGLTCVSKLTAGKTFLCTSHGSAAVAPSGSDIQTEIFEGPHPAGTVGVHIHTLDPVCREKIVWYVNYQDVVAIGRLLATGKLDVERVAALSGPTVTNPRLLQTRIGACLDELVDGELADCENRVVSGSVLSGRQAMGDVLGYLGRYHLQVSVLHEGREREFMGWVLPGAKKYSTTKAYLAAFLPKKKYAFTTTTNGSDRAIVPIGMYERVMPMDIQPTYLLRSLVSRDMERAEALGALELEEEDLALCAFVCPGKIDYGPILRENLTTMEKEG